MFRRMSFVLAVVATLLLGAGVARADDPYRVVLSRVDPSDFPTVRLVASVIDASAADLLEAADPKARRAIVLLTDGLDTASHGSRQSAVKRLQSSGFPLYAIGLGNGIDRGTLDALSGAVRGGATYLAPSSSDLAAIYGRLSEQLLTEYSGEYRSAATNLATSSIVPFEITVGRPGAILPRATATFTVPAGGGQARSPVPTTAPASPPTRPHRSRCAPRTAGSSGFSER